MRTMLLRAALVVIATSAMNWTWAASHQVVSLPTTLSDWESPTLSARWVDTLALSHMTKDGRLRTQWMKRSTRGFSPSSLTSEMSMSELSALSGLNTFHLRGTQVDPYGLYHLTEAAACDSTSTSCTTPVTVLTAHADNGSLFTARAPKPAVVVPKSAGCEKPASLWPAVDAVWVFDGCTTLLQYDTKLNLVGNRTFTDSNGIWKFHRGPSYDLSNASGAKPLPSILTIGRLLEGQGSASWEWQQETKNGEFSPLSSIVIATSVKRCEWLTVAPIQLLCEQTAGGLAVILPDGTVKKEWTDPLSPQDPKDRTLTTHHWTAFAQGTHAFILRSQTQSDPQPQPTDPKAPPVPPLLSESLRVSNVRVDDGARYQVFTHQGTDTSASYELRGSFVRDPGHYYAAALLRQSGRWWLSLQDHITQDQEPRWLQSVGAVMGSGQELRLPLRYDDDTYFSNELHVGITANPPWVTRDRSETDDAIKLTPTHADVGKYTWTLTLSQPSEPTKTSEMPASVEVVLSPYQLMLFEAELFKKYKIEAPVPMNALLQALGGRLKVLENEPLALALSFNGRNAGDVKLEIKGAPAFLQWDSERSQLIGTPDQADVGRHLTLEVRMQDKYSPVVPETGEPSWVSVSLPIEVFEVDDPLKIVSVPPVKAQVNVAYNYTLRAEDEETLPADLKVRLGSAPSWLKLDDKASMLSGTPSVRDVGTHRVQVSISDSGGHTVIQTFDIQVENPEQLQEKSGGAGLGGFGLVLCVLAYFRRRSSITRIAI